MTKIKLCGLSRACDIEAANHLKPDYIGFVFYKKSQRYVSPEKATQLKRLLLPDIQAVGVFVDEEIETIAELFNNGTIEIAQLHGHEDEVYIQKLKQLTNRPLIKAFRIKTQNDINEANQSTADAILLDAGTGMGETFDWSLLQDFKRPYFLAGGLNLDNITRAVTDLQPLAVDVSSGIETNGRKDQRKMAAFVAAVRKERDYDKS